MDREAWYSVTPEPIAKYLATRISDVTMSAHNRKDQNLD
jgi:hypothetical protein